MEAPPHELYLICQSLLLHYSTTFFFFNLAYFLSLMSCHSLADSEIRIPLQYCRGWPLWMWLPCGKCISHDSPATLVWHSLSKHLLQICQSRSSFQHWNLLSYLNMKSYLLHMPQLYCLGWQILPQPLVVLYRIALIFCRSKYSQITVLKEFV